MNEAGCRKGSMVAKCDWKRSKTASQTLVVKTEESSTSSADLPPSFAADEEMPTAFRERCRLGLSQSLFLSSPSASAARSRLAAPPPTPMAGAGYTHSRPEDSQARQVVSMPALTHFILLRRQRAQAILDRIVTTEVGARDGMPVSPAG